MIRIYSPGTNLRNPRTPIRCLANRIQLVRNMRARAQWVAVGDYNEVFKTGHTNALLRPLHLSNQVPFVAAQAQRRPRRGPEVHLRNVQRRVQKPLCSQFASRHPSRQCVQMWAVLIRVQAQEDVGSSSGRTYRRKALQVLSLHVQRVSRAGREGSYQMHAHRQAAPQTAGRGCS